jgi:hypothetical protein
MSAVTVDASLFRCGHLERLSLGTSYVGIVQHAARLLHRLPAGTELAIDFTGVGRPVFDMFAAAGLSATGVLITGGTSDTYAAMATAMGKALMAFGISTLVYMVSHHAIAEDIMPLENEKSRGELLLEQTRQEFEANPPTKQEDYSLIAAFSFPGDISWDRKLNPQRTNSHFGIDLSH